MASTLLLIVVVLCSVYLSSATYQFPGCNAPPAPSYGSFYPRKYQYSVGSTVRFSCRDGYILKGYSFTKCVYSRSLRKSVWRFRSPICRREKYLNMFANYFSVFVLACMESNLLQLLTMWFVIHRYFVSKSCWSTIWRGRVDWKESWVQGNLHLQQRLHSCW